MDSAQSIFDSSLAVAQYYADLHGEASGPEQLLYGELSDAFSRFASEIEDRETVQRKDTSDYA